MKLNLLLALSIVATCLFFTSCGDSSDYMANIKLEYDGEPLVMFEEVTYPSGQSLELTRVSFFLSDVTLSGSENVNVVKEVDYLDLTAAHATSELASNGFDYKLIESEDEYNTLSFNIGLTSAQNATVPEDYPSSNVLSNNGEYWSGWNSYVMMKIEGMIDLDGDGAREKGIALHLGTDEVTRSFTTSVDSDKINITIDLKDVFDCGGEVHDIVNTPAIHNLAKLPEAIRLMDNLECAMTIE